MPTTKPRINVTLSIDNFNKLKLYADSMGMTMSALGAYFINQGIISYNKTFEMLERTPELVSGQISMQDILAEHGKDIDKTMRAKKKK